MELLLLVLIVLLLTGTLQAAVRVVFQLAFYVAAAAVLGMLVLVALA